MADTAGQVPSKFDIVIDGHGYTLLRTIPEGGGVALRTPRAEYSWSPTFIERQNVSGAYGDNAQDFFLTESQNDWSLGEEQRYFRGNDADRVRRYWLGLNVDPVSTPGQVGLRNSVSSLAFSETTCAVAETNVGTAGVYAAGAASLTLTPSTGVISNKGAHGLGATPSQWGLTTDGSNAYISTTGAGTVGVRKWNGSVFSTFSATGADSLAYLDNILFGYQDSTGRLIEYSTAGAASTLFTWQDAAGSALTGASYSSRLRPYGGLLYILRPIGVRGHGELWQFDGTNTTQLAEMPFGNFVAKDMEVASGVVFVAGYLSQNNEYRPAVCWYANGTIGLLWKAPTAGYANATWPALAAYGSGIAFTDDTTGRLLQYDLTVGGIHTMGSYTVTNATVMMAASRDILVHTRNSSTGYLFPSTSVATSGYVISSLVDFENSLTKDFRGVKVEFDAPTGSTVDIAYQVDSVDGAFTSLQTTAVSGTEYTLSGVSGTAIAVKMTLNKGSSSTGPKIKRVYIRAAPRLQSYRSVTLHLDMSGRDGESMVRLNDGSDSLLDGLQMATNLRTSLAAGVVSVTDRFGTYSAVIEPGDTTFREIRPEEYITTVKVREV